MFRRFRRWRRYRRDMWQKATSQRIYKKADEDEHPGGQQEPPRVSARR